MKNYELMVIYTPILSDDEFKAGTKNLKKIITENGGEIVGDYPWGLRSFAYPIDKKTTGLYYVLEFTAEPAFISKLQIQMSRDESIMRTLLTTLDKHAVAYNARKRNGETTNVKSNSLTENTEA